LITCYFYIEGALPLPQWLETLSRKGLGRGWSKHVNPMGVYSHSTQAEGLTLELQQVLQYNQFCQTIERLFQVKPSMKMIFRIDESMAVKDGLAGIISMLQIVSAALAMERGNALCLARNHEIILHRKLGELLLNSDMNFWIPIHLLQIRLPYELRPLPTPLLE
jgi:hypothetical protein